MESTRTKVEVMKPVLLKAGIPLAISLAGFIFARLTIRKNSVSKALNSENQVNSVPTDSHEESRDEESFHSLDSCMDDEEQHIVTSTHFTNPLACLLSWDKSDAEEEILGLRCRIQELQEREWKLEMRFLQYFDMKEKESVLMELHNKLLLEMAHVEFMGKEVSSMEAENRRFEELVVEYLRIVEQFGFARLENGLLQRKVEKLSRKTKGMFRVIREQNMQIEEKEAEVLRNHEELQRNTNVVKALEDQITELQIVVHQQQQEKIELLNKLDLAENSASSNKIEKGIKLEDYNQHVLQIEEGIKLDDYNQLVNELEQVQKDRAAEVKELIFLRWCNACLRHELMTRNQEQEKLEERNDHLELESGGSGEIGHFGLENGLDGLVMGHSEACSSGVTVTAGACAHSKKPKLIQKLRKWVEGSEKMKEKVDGKEKHEVKCFGRTLVSDGGAEERHFPPRKSYSSA